MEGSQRERSLDEVLARIESAYDEGHPDQAWKELSRALKSFPGKPDLLEWEALLALEDGRMEGALSAIGDVLAQEPRNEWAKRLRTMVLVEMGRFEEALEALDALEKEGWRSETGDEEAAFRNDRALCLDRLGRAAEADREFHEAARIAPEDYPEPLRLSAERFDELVSRALDEVPAEFGGYLEQVMVIVRDYPGPDDPDPFILGVYHGVPRTERSQESKDHLDRVVIFKRSHETLGLDEKELEEEVRKTVIHEIAHHFGLGEDDMGEYA